MPHLPRSTHRSLRGRLRAAVVSRRADDRGEGVISAAIAVLIMAGIGALMWVGFKAMWHDTEDNTRDKVTEIGALASSPAPPASSSS